MFLSHSGAFSNDSPHSQEQLKATDMSGGGSVTMPTPKTTTEDPWESVVGLDIVMALVLALLGIGISIAVGILACRYWCKKKAKEDKSPRKSSIYKPRSEKDHQRHLDRYNKVSVTSSSGLLPVQEEEEGEPFDPPADHYFTDVMHSKDVCMVREYAGRSSGGGCDNKTYVSMVPIPPTSLDTSTTELVSMSNSRLE